MDENAVQYKNFTVKKGSITAIIGPDGAVKTTLMRMICGLIEPLYDDLIVLGQNVRGNEQEIQNQLSYMPQKFGLYEDLSIEKNMKLYADLHGVSDKIRARRIPHLLNVYSSLWHLCLWFFSANKIIFFKINGLPKYMKNR